MQYCEQTGKVCFNSKQDAELVLSKKKKKRKSIRKRALRNRIALDTKEVSKYKCKYCGFWHLAGK